MTEVLSEQQKRFYDLFGYLVVPGILADVIEDITSEFEATFAERGDAQGGQAPRNLSNLIDDSERLRALLDDHRIDGIVAGLLGHDYNYLGSYGNLWGGDTDWHPNKQPEPYGHLTLALYLDPVGADTGALRVIPGSHKAGAYRDEVMPIVAGPPAGRLDSVDADDVDGIAEIIAAQITQITSGYRFGDSKPYTQVLGLAGPDIPAAVLESKPGDVVVFNEGTIHSAWGGSTRRRQVQFVFAQHCPDEHLSVLRKHVTRIGAVQWKDHLYHEALIATAGEQRMRHLAQPISVEDQLPKVVQRLRELVPESARTP